MQHIWNRNVSAVLHEALQGLQIRYASLSTAKLILAKMKNENINLCIMTQGLQIRYALLPVQHYNPDSNQNQQAPKASWTNAHLADRAERPQIIFLGLAGFGLVRFPDPPYGQLGNQTRFGLAWLVWLLRCPGLYCRRCWHACPWCFTTSPSIATLPVFESPASSLNFPTISWMPQWKSYLSRLQATLTATKLKLRHQQAGG